MTLVRWLQTRQLPEPRHVRAAGMDIRVWSRADLERARRVKQEHGEAALKMKTARTLKVDQLRRDRRAGKGTSDKKGVK